MIVRSLSRLSLLFAVQLLIFGYQGAPEAAENRPELVGQWSHGPARGVASAGDHAFFGSGTVLHVADISVPEDPQILATLVLPGLVEEIVLDGEFACIATGVAG